MKFVECENCKKSPKKRLLHAGVLLIVGVSLAVVMCVIAIFRPLADSHFIFDTIVTILGLGSGISISTIFTSLRKKDKK